MTSVSPFLDFFLAGVFGILGILTGYALAVRFAKRPAAIVHVNVPEVKLPDTLTAIIQQPPAPVLPRPPKDRATVWQEVYEHTFGDPEDYDNVRAQEQGAQAAREIADAAVDKAFPKVISLPPYETPRQEPTAANNPIDT